jgi:hypothetical protein
VSSNIKTLKRLIELDSDDKGVLSEFDVISDLKDSKIRKFDEHFYHYDGNNPTSRECIIISHVVFEIKRSIDVDKAINKLEESNIFSSVSKVEYRKVRCVLKNDLYIYTDNE